MTDRGLKPCPFCGGEADIERMGDRLHSMIYACQECGASLETGETWLGAECRWNRRADRLEALASRPDGWRELLNDADTALRDANVSVYTSVRQRIHAALSALPPAPQPGDA